MELTVLGTGSQGNSYVLESESGERLVIEAGVNFKRVKKHLNFNLKNVSGVIVSHAHL